MIKGSACIKSFAGLEGSDLFSLGRIANVAEVHNLQHMTKGGVKELFLKLYLFPTETRIA